MQYFKDFMVTNGLSDVRYAGTYHTWWNKRKSNPITRKLDRILGNPVWLSTQQCCDVIFTPWGLPRLFSFIQDRFNNSPKAFQFYNYWQDHPDSLQTVSETWSTSVTGNPMYILSQKLRMVKHKLMAIRKSEGSITSQISIVRQKLCEVQEKILNRINDSSLFNLQSELSSNLVVLLSKEESIAHQRSRVQWFDLGDQNTSYFQHLYNDNLQNYPGIDQLNSLISKKISPHQAQLLTVKATDAEIFAFNLHKTDDICWNGIPSKCITVTDLWRGIRHVGTSVPWATCVWHRVGVPRYSFLHWLIMHNRVNTLSRLKRFDPSISDSCYFCINGVEKVQHLFYECPFTHAVHFKSGLRGQEC
ncbi:hypothetical protein POM88_049544 [Heracleum sosnowskyi]|uniref:Reverse transcriptase zinc-binding domain-containing protein n=1 Tax=Heracleum sosnowskyi TaxID=360622 RepID=A0AAD8GX76_9APIA|nr:hypothetical protein POM88_049544 [Heracleum sosnowskyi]